MMDMFKEFEKVADSLELFIDCFKTVDLGGAAHIINIKDKSVIEQAVTEDFTLVFVYDADEVIKIIANSDLNFVCDGLKFQGRIM